MSRRKRKHRARKHASYNPQAIIKLCPGCLEKCTIVQAHKTQYLSCPVCRREIHYPIETEARNYRSENVRRNPRLDIPLPQYG